jgi:hypothetical protein
LNVLAATTGRVCRRALEAGGWILGVAGATVGAAAGAVNGWLFNRWIMPEYDKRRKRAVPPPGSTDGAGLSGSMVEHC